jgi:hypothetical protein
VRWDSTDLLSFLKSLEFNRCEFINLKTIINEIYTAARWDVVDILSFFKSIGFDRSNFFNLCKKLEQKE